MNIAPNRLAVYFVAAAALLTALTPVFTDLGWTEVTASIGALASITLIVGKWLQGWQQYESERSFQDHERFMQDLREDEV